MATNHGGANWTPVNGSELNGTHTNVGTFSITSGYTCNVAQGIPFAVYAETITIAGDINGIGKGYAGGTVNSNGAGPGGGTKGSTNVIHAGGGGYGGDGGDGYNNTSTQGIGGDVYGNANGTVAQMGSGGAGGSSGGGTASGGGNGGGSVILCANTISIAYGATVLCHGTDGGYAASPGAGGSGGGVLLICNHLNIDGAAQASGGMGGASSGTGGGGGGGGGRCKTVCATYNNDPYNFMNAAGGTSQGIGDPGLIGTEDVCNTLGKLDATHPVGQTFNFGIAGSVVMTQVILKAGSYTTAGVCTLTVYNNSSKSVTYGSASNTIDSTSDETWTFTTPVELPDGQLDYYMELTTSAAVCTMAYSCTNNFSDYMYYEDGEAVGVSLYMKLYTYAHVVNPVVYNKSKSNVKCHVANKILTGARHTIRADGIGNVQYADDLITAKYVGDCSVASNDTYYDISQYLRITFGGTLEYKIDCKYPIVGMPKFTALINLVASGVGTIQIAEDVDGLPGMWYDVPTDVPDDTQEDYLFECDSLSFEGKTILYFRFNVTVGEFWIKQFSIDIKIDTTSAQIPQVIPSDANTFVCDQDETSSIDCIVELKYSDVRY